MPPQKIPKISNPKPSLVDPFEQSDEKITVIDISNSPQQIQNMNPLDFENDQMDTDQTPQTVAINNSQNDEFTIRKNINIKRLETIKPKYKFMISQSSAYDQLETSPDTSVNIESCQSVFFTNEKIWRFKIKIRDEIPTEEIICRLLQIDIPRVSFEVNCADENIPCPKIIKFIGANAKMHYLMVVYCWAHEMSSLQDLSYYIKDMPCM
jgi:hypothetical protein